MSSTGDRRRDGPIVKRDSNMVRASVLDVALELGIGRNRTVTNWMFSNGIGEEDEGEEECAISPGLTSASTTTSEESIHTPQTGSGAFVYPIPDKRKADKTHPNFSFPLVAAKMLGSRPNVDRTGESHPLPLTPHTLPLTPHPLPLTPQPSPSIPHPLPPTPLASPLPPEHQSRPNFFRMRTKSKHEDGYETDGTGGKKKKKSKKKKHGEGDATDGDYISEAGSSSKKGKSNKTKNKSDVGGNDTDTTGGYLSESASVKKKKSFFRMKTKSSSSQRQPAPTVPPLPRWPPSSNPLPKSDAPGDSAGGATGRVDNASLKKVSSNESDTSGGYAQSIDVHRSSEDTVETVSSESAPPQKGFHFKMPHKSSRKDERVIPTISLPISLSGFPERPPGMAARRPSALTISVPGSNPGQTNRSLSPFPDSDYIMLTPNASTHATPTNADRNRSVSPSPSDYTIIPSENYLVASPLPSPRANMLAYYDLPPPSPPPVGPLPTVPSSKDSPTGGSERTSSPVTRPSVLAYYDLPPSSPPPTGPLPVMPSSTGRSPSRLNKERRPSVTIESSAPSSFLDFERHSLEDEHPSGPTLSPHPVPSIQRGRVSPFPSRPVLPRDESASLVRRTSVTRSASATPYSSRAPPPVALRYRGIHGSTEHSEYMNAGNEGGTGLLRAASAMERRRPEVVRAPDVMSGIDINIEQASEHGDSDGEWDEEENPDMQDVMSRFQEGRAVKLPGTVFRGLPASPRPAGVGSVEQTPEPENDDDAEGPEEYDDDQSQYPDDDKTAGRSTMYMLEGEELRYSMYVGGNRASRASFLDGERSWETRERFVKRVEAMFGDDGREIVPPMPKLKPGMRMSMRAG